MARVEFDEAICDTCNEDISSQYWDNAQENEKLVIEVTSDYDFEVHDAYDQDVEGLIDCKNCENYGTSHCDALIDWMWFKIYDESEEEPDKLTPCEDFVPTTT